VLRASLFKRLNQASLLDHFVRGRLCQVIRENPGIHFAELRRRAGFANGSTSHHLRILEQGGYLRVVIDGGKTRFYAADRPVDKSVYGLSDCDRAVLRVVAASPGISEGDLSRELDRSLSTVNRAVSRLSSLGYLTTEHEGRTVNVFLRSGAEIPMPTAPAWPADEM